MTRPRVDWFRVLVELERKGYNPYAISTSTGIARSTLLGWRNYSAEPNHADGEILVRLWVQVVGPHRDALPLNVDDLLSAAKAK